MHGFHGVYDFERVSGQDFIVDVTLWLDTTRAATSDDIVETIHYGHLADALVAVVSGEPVNLLETLAARLADTCLTDDRVSECTITVHKPQAPIAHQFADVSVTITRSRS